MVAFVVHSSLYDCCIVNSYVGLSLVNTEKQRRCWLSKNQIVYAKIPTVEKSSMRVHIVHTQWHGVQLLAVPNVIQNM